MSTTPPPASPPDSQQEPPPDAPPSPPDAPPSGPPFTGGPRLSGEQLRDISGLRRSRSDRKVAGVAGGLGRHLDVDPTVIRVAFVVLTLFGGAGILLYAVCWLVVPDEGSARASIDLAPGIRLLVLGGFAAVAVLALLGRPFWSYGFPWPFAAVGVAVLAVVAGRDWWEDNRSARPDPAPAYAAPPPVEADVTAAPAGTVSLEKQPDPVAGTAWTAPFFAAPPTVAPPVTPPVAPAPPRPRRGPRLLLPTLALVAVGLGVLRLVELGGADIPLAAYAALALAICGVVLVVGAWFGRAGGVLLLALLSAVALAAAAVGSAGVGSRVVEVPTSAAGLSSSYSIAVGRLSLDLTGVTDLASLDGRTIDLHGSVGRIEVTVPAGVDVTARGTVSGPGRVEVFGAEADGNHPSVTRQLDGGTDAPHLTIDADLSVGAVTVRTP